MKSFTHTEGREGGREGERDGGREGRREGQRRKQGRAHIKIGEGGRGVRVNSVRMVRM